MKMRFRYSLRTLLLAAFLAGGVMLVWRVREPYALRTVRIADLYKELVKSDVGIRATFSRSGRFVSLEPEYQFVQRYISPLCIFDIESGKVVDQFAATRYDTWHPTRDLYIRPDFGGRYSVIDYATQSRPFEIKLPTNHVATFSPGGKYVVERATQLLGRSSILCETETWKPVDGLPAMSDEDKLELSANDRWLLILHRGRLKCETSLELFDMVTRKTRWGTATVFDGLSGPRAGFAIDPTRIDVCGYAMVQAEDRIKDLAIVANYQQAEKERRTVHFQLSIESGVECPDSYSTSERPFVIASDEVMQQALQPVMSADGAWRLHTSKDNQRAAISDYQTGLTLFTLSAKGETLNPRLSISKNNERIAGSSADNKLLLWTRTRQNVAWWGLIERPETWLAAALLAAFIWSIIRDIRSKTPSP